jgi:hypothetical protein
MVLCMGLDCGKHSIIGFEGVIRESSRRRQYHHDLKRLDKWIEKARLRLIEVQRRIDLRAAAVETLRDDLPKLYTELMKRRKGGARDLEVHTSSDKSQTRLLAGMAILDSKQSALQKLRSVLASYEQLEKSAPAIDGPSAEALRKQAQLFDDRAARLDEWYRETAAFLTEQNFALALFAVGAHDAKIGSDSLNLHVSYMFGGSATIPLGPLP